MFNTGSRPTALKLVAESADYSADSTANPEKVSVWVRAFARHLHKAGALDL